VRFGGEHTIDLVELIGNNVSDLFMIADADHRDEVDLAGDAVDLGDAGKLRNLLGHLGYPVDSSLDEDDRGNHELTLSGEDVFAEIQCVGNHSRFRCVDRRHVPAEASLGELHALGVFDQVDLRTSQEGIAQRRGS
jgi:hypothetical protein